MDQVYFLVGVDYLPDQRWSMAFGLDCYVDIQSTFKSRLTKHPVESGSDITDHAILENVEIRLTGVVSNTPVNVPIPEENEIGVNNPLRSLSAYSIMKNLWSSKTLLTVVTDYDTFRNCIITSIGMPQKSGTPSDSALEFEVQLEQLRIVASEVITVAVAPPQRDDSTETSEGGNRDRNSQSRLGREFGQTGRQLGDLLGGYIEYAGDQAIQVGTGQFTIDTYKALFFGD